MSALHRIEIVKPCTILIVTEIDHTTLTIFRSIDVMSFQHEKVLMREQLTRRSAWTPIQPALFWLQCNINFLYILIMYIRRICEFSYAGSSESCNGPILPGMIKQDVTIKGAAETINLPWCFKIFRNEISLEKLYTLRSQSNWKKRQKNPLDFTLTAKS